MIESIELDSPGSRAGCPANTEESAPHNPPENANVLTLVIAGHFCSAHAVTGLRSSFPLPRCPDA